MLSSTIEVRKLENPTFEVQAMIVEVRPKNQITIPSKIVRESDIKIGDKFEVIVKDGMICLVPIVVYPKKYIEEMEAEVERLKKECANSKTYENAKDMFDDLDAQIDAKNTHQR